MNIIQLHDKVLGFLDQGRSGRIHWTMLDSAINASHSIVLNQKKGTEGLTSPVSYYPEESNRIKDSLRYYYKESATVTGSLSLNITIAVLPFLLSDFLNVEINVGSVGVPKWITPIPINKKDKSEINGNTFLKPQNQGWPVFYFTYSGGILEFLLPGGTGIVEVKIGYLRFPVYVFSGIHVQKSDFSVSGKTVIVTSPKAIYGGVVKMRGEEIENADFASLTLGDVCYDYSIVDIDPNTIDLIASMSATSIANLRAGNLNIGNTKE